MSVTDTPENAKKCICVRCPSFPGKPGFYCARGKAKKVVRKGCICMDCRVHAENGLKGGYFCASGKAP